VTAAPVVADAAFMRLSAWMLDNGYTVGEVCEKWDAVRRGQTIRFVVRRDLRRPQ